MPASTNHYHWAGLDFMIDQDGVPVFLEANRSTHMLLEYWQVYQDDTPFKETARIMNERGGGPACFLWRKDDKPDAEENICFITDRITPFLETDWTIVHWEDNRNATESLQTPDGKQVTPASLFRWWYPISWSFERSGVCVFNPNAVWMVVRDKLKSYEILRSAENLRVPASWPVNDAAEAVHEIANRNELQNGFVVKPRTGFGGDGVQVGDAEDKVQPFAGRYLVSERIRPFGSDGTYWDARVFVMGGRFIGGLMRVNDRPVTNIFQGGRPKRLESRWTRLLEPAAVEAVRLLDEAADEVHRQPAPADSALTQVEW